MLTQERLKELLYYDPELGWFMWLVARKGSQRGAVQPGDTAGTVRASIHGDRLLIGIDGRSYFAYRLAWLYMTGKWPDAEIDHIDTDPINDRWTNLRDISHRGNSENKKRAKRGSASGLLGAMKHRERWLSRITVHGKPIHLGVFDTPEQAHDAYLIAKRELHEGCTI